MSWRIYKDQKHEYESDMNHAHSFFWAGHVDFVYDLLRNEKPGVVVELGTHYGRSLFAMAQAVKDGALQNDIKLHAVDTWLGDDHTGRYKDEVYDSVNSIAQRYYKDINITLHRKTFDEALFLFRDKEIDVLHIDGYHTYEAAKHDFDTWLPKMKAGGTVLFHDVAEHKKDFGVHILWLELLAQKEKYEGFRFYQSHGLGVLFLKNGTNLISRDLQENAQFLVDYYYDVGSIRKNRVEIKVAQLAADSPKRCVARFRETVKTINKKLKLSW